MSDNETLVPALTTQLFKTYLGNDWFGGLLLHVQGIDAAHASRPLPGGESSVAGQLGHVLYWLKLGNLRMRGEVVKGDQEASFRHSQVTADEWSDLQTVLKSEVLRFQENIQSTEHWNEAKLTIVLDQLGHAAYHAGSVVQILRATQEVPTPHP